VYRRFGNADTIVGSPFANDLNNSEYIVNCLQQIIELTQSDRKMVAIALNKTAEGALFDLFNKFFMRRNGMDCYRVAMESALLLTTPINPKFNGSVLIDNN
jgi:hypothetical protein